MCPLPLDAVGYVSKLWRKRDLNVYFMKPHPQEDTILSWAAEWSKYCAIIFYKTSSPQNSDIRIDFNAGIKARLVLLRYSLVPRPSLDLLLLRATLKAGRLREGLGTRLTQVHVVLH